MSGRLDYCQINNFIYARSLQGDSGGPIQIYATGDYYCTYYVFGVTSFGKKCGFTGIPAGYVKVNAYIKWIEDIVWP